MPENRPPTSEEALAAYQAVANKGLAETIGIELVELTAARVVATMPVNRQTHQPFGILHGGASVALAETVASLGAWMNVDRDQFATVGLEINANHLRPVREGIVRATATPIHVGRTTQVWNIEITDEVGRTVCISRCTMAVVPLKGATQ